MLDKVGITESLANNIVATRWQDIPPQVRHQARRSLINFFAVALAGCRSRPIEIALGLLDQFSDHAQASVMDVVSGSMRRAQLSSTQPAPMWMTSAIRTWPL